MVRYVETVMGTTAGLTLPDETGDGRGPGLAAAVYRWLRRVDSVYSPFLPGSQISLLRDGGLRPADCDPDVRGVLALCEELRERTGGYFDAWAGGVLDPCGVVKGWSVETAGELLADRGVAAYSLNVGGDVRAAGRDWRIGITDPHRSGRVLTVVTGTDLAVATSGVTERGAHVLDPHTGRPATALAAVTLVGPSLTYADAYATAALAMGGPMGCQARRWLCDLPGYAGFAVTATGGVWWTPAFRAYAPDLPPPERAG